MAGKGDEHQGTPPAADELSRVKGVEISLYYGLMVKSRYSHQLRLDTPWKINGWDL